MWKNLINVAIVLLLLAIGCSKDNPTDPPEQITDLEALCSALFSTQNYDSIVVTTADSGDADLDIDLGVSDSAEIVLDGDSVFIIATDSTVSDSADLAMDCRLLNFSFGSDSSKIAMFFNCSPDGLVFDNCLIIDVSPDHFDNHPTANVVKLYIYNADRNRWDLLSALQKTNPRLQFEINHFSKYAISD